jgi:hypothetical protein
MKRSERLYHRAKLTAWFAVLILSASVAVGCWSVRVAFSSAPGGALMLIAALIGFLIFVLRMMEAIRLARLAGIEADYEFAREVRPRL